MGLWATTPGPGSVRDHVSREQDGEEQSSISSVILASLTHTRAHICTHPCTWSTHPHLYTWPCKHQVLVWNCSQLAIIQMTRRHQSLNFHFKRWNGIMYRTKSPIQRNPDCFLHRQDLGLKLIRMCIHIYPCLWHRKVNERGGRNLKRWSKVNIEHT